MSPQSNKWKLGGGLTVFVIIAFPLWREFRERDQTGWNVFLALLLVGIVVAAVFLNRYFSAHAGEIGEARFDTRNSDNNDG